MTPIQRQLLAVAFALLAPLACSASKNPGSGGGGDDNGGGNGNNPGSGGLSGGGDDLSFGDGGAPGLNCGDGKLDADEACDDGNKSAEDGCAADCRSVEPGFVCPDPGQPCRPFAKCGDGRVIFPEQCDDGALDAGDGCSPTCKVEIGWKCSHEGTASSTCSLTVCGDGVQEGTETCEDENTTPFDGCGITCQAEPRCTAEGCTSTCGDGIIIGNEACDDGNTIDGDGCSAECKVEAGYECEAGEGCSTEDPDCVLELPIIFRDFNEGGDFENPLCGGNGNYAPQGMAQATLDEDGKPRATTTASLLTQACTSASTFGEWFRDTPGKNAMIVGGITLYPRPDGAFVNRFGENGEPYVTSVNTGSEQGGYGTSAATCAQTCRQRTGDSLQCVNQCRPAHDMVDQRTRQLEQEQNLANPDPERIATLEAEIEELEAAAAECDTDCQALFEMRVTQCTAQCAPCSSGPQQWCIGGEVLELDGNPLFFPIDDAEGALTGPAARYPAKVPSQIYMANGWPWEPPANVSDQGVPGAGQPLHNFHFTSEIAYWFKYEEDMVANFTFIGDDDVFVYVNRRLVLDLGGIHVPLIGSMNIAAGGAITLETFIPPDGQENPPNNVREPLAPAVRTTAAALGLEPGNVYEIKVFHAERKQEGSSFQLTLSGFNAARSECRAICGDGIIAAGEQCDDGAENNTGGHNRCGADCQLGPYCGDGVVEPGVEQCDDADPQKPPNCFGCRLLVIK